MKLTPRLAAIADLISSGSIVADIGTDHAYLPVYLIQEQICQSVVASDSNLSPLKQAMETVAAFNCLHKVELRYGDGLSILSKDDDVDTIIVAGLGGKAIIAILQRGQEKLAHIRQLILQPMNDSGLLRLFLAKNGYALANELLVMEGKRLYEIILAKPGTENEKDFFRLSIGPRLLEQRPPLLIDLINNKVRKLRVVRDNLVRAKQKDVSAKIKEVEQLITLLEEVLSVDTVVNKQTD